MPVIPPELANRFREMLSEVYRKYDVWSKLPAGERTAQTEPVRISLDRLKVILESELFELNLEADTQSIRTRILLVIVGCLMLFHA